MKKTTLITRTEPGSAASEAYRALRFNLNFTSLDKPLETLVVSSPAIDETKSQVATNLAVVMAEAGRRVILVDADLRRPKLHEIFGVEREPGLSTTIADQSENTDLPLVKTDVEGLSILPSGVLPPNPGDILSSQKMSDLLETMKTQADVIIFDTPPVNLAVDATALATKTDGMLLVVRSGHTRRDHIEQAKRLIERSNVNLLGAILTDSPEHGMWTGY